MPLREHGCEPCGIIVEHYYPAVDPAQVPAPTCLECGKVMQMLFSMPNIDTSDTFHPFEWNGPAHPENPTGKWTISNLHELRKVEKAYQATGHNIRFDAYSAEPSNPDATDGFGLEYWDGSEKTTSRKGFAMPTMNNG